MRRRGLGQEISRGLLGNLVLNSIAVLLGLVTSVTLARLLGSEGYGAYAFAFSVITLLMIPTQVGLPTLCLREIAAYNARGQWSPLKGLLRRSNEIVAFCVVVLSGLLFLTVSLLDFDWFKPYKTVVVAALPLVLVFGLSSLRTAALRGLGHVTIAGLADSIIRPGVFVVLLLMIFASGAYEASAWEAMILHGIAALAGLGVSTWLLSRVMPREVAGVSPIFDTKTWIKSSVPLAVIGGLEVVNRQIDIIMLGMFTTSSDVGIYRAAVSVSGLVAFVLLAMNNVIAPHISRLYIWNKVEQLENLATASARGVLALSVPVAVVLALFGRQILSTIFGPDFGPGYFALVVLCSGQLVNVGAGSVGLLLNMTGHERDAVRAVGIAAGGNVLLNVILIPMWGIVGAATASACALATLNILLASYVTRRLGIRPTVLGSLGGR